MFNSLDILKDFLLNKENYKKFNFPQIAYFANNLVFSKGNHDAKTVIIAEAPGEKEDLLGLPFSGRCGKFLESKLKEINIDQNIDLYFINSVFWRPTEIKKNKKNIDQVYNRKPSFEEIEFCRQYVLNQINLCKNIQNIICLGSSSFASINNLNKKSYDSFKISEKINKNFELNLYGKIMNIYTYYHPNYVMKKSKILSKEFCLFLKNSIII
jgi:uracil-DNA glycosylase family 4